MGESINVVLRGFYLDSVALMRLSVALSARPGVDEAAVMVATPSNLALLEQAGLLTGEGRGASANDAVIAVRANDGAALVAAAQFAQAELETARAPLNATAAAPLTLDGTLREHPTLNLALISVPGEYAALEAHRALERNLHVMLFSDQVSLADEIALKARARDRGRLIMGPDCGTALICGVPLGFANAVPSGPVGIVAASGTGLQELSVRLARAGLGISHGIGVGGRDLSTAVGAISTYSAIDALEADEDTEHIVVISKPPDASIARAVLERLARLDQPALACFLGLETLDGAAAPWFNTLEAAALEVLRNAGVANSLDVTAPPLARATGAVVGLYSGGTLCAEGQTVLRERGLDVGSNIPVPGVRNVGLDDEGHRLIDLGADEFTRGRPHPMLEPQVRAEVLADVLTRAGVGVVLLDVVLGYGGHADPVSAIVATLERPENNRPVLIASICGTDIDPQGLDACTARLKEAGILVAPSAATAARWAADSIGV